MERTTDDWGREVGMTYFIDVLSEFNHNHVPIWPIVNSMKYERDETGSKTPVWERVAIEMATTGEVIFVCITNDDYSEVITAITNAVNYYKEHDEYV